MSLHTQGLHCYPAANASGMFTTVEYAFGIQVDSLCDGLCSRIILQVVTCNNDNYHMLLVQAQLDKADLRIEMSMAALHKQNQKAVKRAADLEVTLGKRFVYTYLISATQLVHQQQITRCGCAESLRSSV